MIAAVARNGVIGNDNDLPAWNIPADMQHFRKTTSGHPVIMGRKTYESFRNMNGGKGLPNRTNIVITRKDWSEFNSSLVIAESPEDALFKVDAALYASSEDGADPKAEIFIIGGAEIYKEFMPKADRLIITRVHGDFEGDTIFPTIPQDEFVRVHVGPDQYTPEGMGFNFEYLERG